MRLASRPVLRVGEELIGKNFACLVHLFARYVRKRI
jgi:hypothetical protein